MNEEWSNDACRGYVIKAMENCGFHAKDIHQVLVELYEVFDFCALLRKLAILTSGQVGPRRGEERKDSTLCRVLSFRFSPLGQCGKCWQSTNYAKEASMVQSVTYQSETKTVHFQGKSIVLESLTPVLSPKEKEKRKKEIERCLYEVFSKYRRASDTPA